MNRRDLVGGLVFLALGAAGLYWAVDLPFGNARLPGPAMLPASLSALIMLFAVVHLARAWRAGRRGGSGPGAPTDGSGAADALLADMPPAAVERSRYLRVGKAALLIALFVALVRPLGFLPTTFLTMSALYLIADEGGFGWRPAVSGAVLTVATWVLFTVLLDVPLPEGTLWQ